MCEGVVGADGGTEVQEVRVHIRAGGNQLLRNGKLEGEPQDTCILTPLAAHRVICSDALYLSQELQSV
jgi:hypothetical protein